MPTVGTDCEVILDGVWYYVKPGSYQIQRPRVRRATVRADGNESYVDLGPGKRVWTFTVLAFSNLSKADGSTTGVPGQHYRDALWTSYAKVATTLSFTDRQGNNQTVRFDDLREIIPDLRGQQTVIQYELQVTLREA